MSVKEEDLIYYTIERLGEGTPFRLSRILFLLDLSYWKTKGQKLTSLRYILSPFVFYVEDFRHYLEQTPGVKRIEIKDEQGNPVRGYFKVVSFRKVNLDEKVEKLLDEIIDFIKGMSDEELNEYVTGLPEYKKFCEEGIWE